MIAVTKIRHFYGHRQSIYCMDKTDHGHFISAGSDGLVVQWTTEEKDGVLVASMPEPVFASCYDNGRYYTGTRSGALYQIDIAEKKLVRQWQAHTSAIFAIAVKNALLYTAGEDGKLKVWETASGTLLSETQLSSKSLRCLVPDNAGGWLAGDSNGQIHFLDKNLVLEARVDANKPSVFSIAAAGNTLFSAGRDALIWQWNTLLREETRQINAHWYTIHHLALSPGNRWLASGSMDKTIKLWDPQTLELLKVIDFERYQSHTSSVNKIVWVDKAHFLSCSDDRNICLFGIDGETA